MREIAGVAQFRRSLLIVIFSVTTAVVPLASATAEAGAKKLALLGQLNLPTAASVRNSDVWGWVNPANGKEFAIVGEWGGRNIYMIDVSDPANPTLASTIRPTPGFDFKTWGNYLYAVDGDGQLLDGKIWDISNPYQPVFRASMPSAHNITIVDGYLYKAVNGTTIYDLHADPTVPQILSFVGSFNGGHDTTVIGNRLYDFHGTVGTFIYDVTDKAAPLLLGSLENPYDFGITYHHNGYPTEDGQHLFITDELAVSGAADITVWDISNPENMVMVGGYTDPNASVHNVFVVGNLLFASFYKAGVRVFDITMPWNPILVDTYDTAPNLSGEGFDGNWGVYPFAPSGVIYASDMRTGLYLFSLPGFTVPVAISAFDAKVGDGGVELSWAIAEADGLSGFRIYRSVGNDDAFAPIANLPANVSYRYTDNDVRPGESYWYQLGAFDIDGEFRSTVSKVTVPDIEFALGQNYPNPFNPNTSIEYVVPEDGFVSLVVYNAHGQRVRTLVKEVQSAGTRSVGWNGTDDGGMRVASGVYFYRLEAATSTETRSMVLLK